MRSPERSPVELSRRTLVGGGLAGAATLLVSSRLGAGASCGHKDAAPQIAFSKLGTSKKLSTKFGKWFSSIGVSRASGVQNMIWNFYDVDAKKPSWVYPMLSGKAIVWSLKRGDVPAAKKFAEALLAWQQMDEKGALARSYGAFPSKLERVGGSFKAGSYYYSGDNLMILEALVMLYERTKEFKYLNAAIGVGTWITSVMSQGHRYGVWAQDHGAPMQAVSASGDFVNKMYGQVESLWITSLKQLGQITAEPAYCRQADKAYELYRKSQMKSGAYMDHFDPGWPPKKYSPKNWKPYAPGQLISDNVLRMALGACRMGDLDSARRFHRWLVPENGGVPAYLDIRSGQSGFEKPSDTYYDVVASGMYRSLCGWLGDKKGAAASVAFLKRVQHDNGGFFWGWRRSGGPLTPEQAPIVGMWATSDLSRPRG